MSIDKIFTICDMHIIFLNLMIVCLKSNSLCQEDFREGQRKRIIVDGLNNNILKKDPIGFYFYMTVLLCITYITNSQVALIFFYIPMISNFIISIYKCYSTPYEHTLNVIDYFDMLFLLLAKILFERALGISMLGVSSAVSFISIIGFNIFYTIFLGTTSIIMLVSTILKTIQLREIKTQRIYHRFQFKKRRSAYWLINVYRVVLELFINVAKTFIYCIITTLICIPIQLYNTMFFPNLQKFQKIPDTCIIRFAFKATVIATLAIIYFMMLYNDAITSQEESVFGFIATAIIIPLLISSLTKRRSKM